MAAIAHAQVALLIRDAVVITGAMRNPSGPIVANFVLTASSDGASYVQESASRICTMLDDLTSALPMGAGLLAETVRESPDDARALAQMMRRLAEGHASPRYPNRPRILMALARLLEDRLAVELMHASETKTQ